MTDAFFAELLDQQPRDHASLIRNYAAIHGEPMPVPLQIEVHEIRQRWEQRRSDELRRDRSER